MYFQGILLEYTHSDETIDKNLQWMDGLAIKIHVKLKPLKLYKHPYPQAEKIKGAQ